MKGPFCKEKSDYFQILTPRAQGFIKEKDLFAKKKL